MLAGKRVHATCCYAHRSCAGHTVTCTHTHTYAPSYTSPLCFIFININLNSCACLSPFEASILYTSKKKCTHTHGFTHTENVGHAGRIYSRIQNTGRKLFSFNLFLSLLQYGGLDKTKVTKTRSLLTGIKNKMVAWQLIKRTRCLLMEICTKRCSKTTTYRSFNSPVLLVHAHLPCLRVLILLPTYWHAYLSGGQKHDSDWTLICTSAWCVNELRLRIKVFTFRNIKAVLCFHFEH